MDVLYISPSVMPSRSANSVHVVRMCEAFVEQGHSVTLCINRSISSEKGLRKYLEDYYGVSLQQTQIVSFYTRLDRALNIRIALSGLWEYLKRRLSGTTPDLVISRNLYAAFLLRWLAVGNRIFETHQVERGIQKWIQQTVIRDRKTQIVVISKALSQQLSSESEVDCSKFLVLPDAAPAGNVPLTTEEKMERRKVFFRDVDLDKFSLIVGYFGHLYEGRGIHIIRGLAKRHPTMAFLLFGGHERQILEEKYKESSNNFLVRGYLPPRDVLSTMGLMDVLVMPYQTSVSIGHNHDETGRWMSPMKMFEYMASGVPIVASKLSVLQEVLSHDDNCLLAEPNDLSEWSECLERLVTDPELGRNISANAYAQYVQEYNWNTRASKMIRRVVM